MKQRESYLSERRTFRQGQSGQLFFPAFPYDPQPDLGLLDVVFYPG